MLVNAARAYLIVGLGNPGNAYVNTRHNAGFMVAEALAHRHGLEFNSRNRLYHSATGQIADSDVLIIKPQTFMNNSGQAVQSVLTKYGFEKTRILVLVDDCRIELGQVRLRANGGSGGHNGLSSIIECLGYKDFARLRLGLGAPPANDHIDFVLGKFPTTQMELVREMVETAADCCEDFINEGVERAMSNFNGKVPHPPA